jgi:hypothetical protein
VPASVGTAMLRTSCENFFSTRFCCKTRLCVDYCSKVGRVLKPPVQRLEFSEFSLLSHGEFSVMHTRCSMKCVKGLELLVVCFWLP